MNPADVTADTKIADILEAETCSRCLGSGRYSYNMLDGDRCYGCGGAGRRLTKRGKAARDYLHALQELPVDLIQPGDRIYHQGWRTVTDIRPSTSGRILKADDPKVAKLVAEGARVEPYHQDGKVLVYVGVDLVTSKVTLCARTGTERVSDPTLGLALKRSVATYQEMLTKAGTPVKASRIGA